MEKWIVFGILSLPILIVSCFFYLSNRNEIVYFHQQAPILTNPMGFHLWVYLTGCWDDKYKIRPSNYAERGELNIDFQMFLCIGEFLES